MAVKKTTKKKEVSATPTKAEAKEPAPKTTTKKAAAPKAAAPVSQPVSTPTAARAPASKAKAAPKKAAAKKVAAPLKLSVSHGDLLKKIGGAVETGYAPEKKAEQRSIDSLLEKKLIKKGAKDKATGSARYHISGAGKKHIS